MLPRLCSSEFETSLKIGLKFQATSLRPAGEGRHRRQRLRGEERANSQAVQGKTAIAPLLTETKSHGKAAAQLHGPEWGPRQEGPERTGHSQGCGGLDENGPTGSRVYVPPTVMMASASDTVGAPSHMLSFLRCFSQGIFTATGH